MLNVAHFSDLHYADGAKLVEVDRCFSYAVDDAIQRQVKCAVVSGDATDHALDVHTPAIIALAKNIRRLADHCPVLLIQGTFSHEPQGTLSIFRLLGGKYPVHVADRISQVALTTDGTWVESSGWAFDAVPDSSAALFTCIPTVNKAVIGAVVGATNAAAAVGEQLSLLLAGYAPINNAARAAGVPTIGVSHGTVYGCLTEHDVPMAGNDHEFTTANLFSAAVSAWMLGHIHKHQSWEDGAGHAIAYAGSIARLHYGEVGDKGYLTWAVGAKAASCDLVQTPARRTIELNFDGMPDMDYLRTEAEKVATQGAFVRIRWTVPEEDRDTIDRDAIARLFAGKAVEVKMEGRIIPVVRTRAAGISTAQSVADKIVMWASVTGAEPQPLLGCLEQLHADTPETIAEKILYPSGGAPTVAVKPQAVAPAVPVILAPANGKLVSLELF